MTPKINRKLTFTWLKQYRPYNCDIKYFAFIMSKYKLINK